MAVKRLVIPYGELPAPSMVASVDQVRYRVSSDDQNRKSAWTPIFSVNQELSYYTEGDLLLEYVQDGVITVAWSGVSVMKNLNGTLTQIATVSDFDIWIRWSGVANINPGAWEYQGRISSQSMNVAIPPLYSYGVSSTAAPKYFEIEIYRPSYEIMRDPVSPFRMYNGALDIQTSTISGINTDISGINLDITTLYTQDDDNFALSLVL